eukprot:snap_masked-scaffold_10-processed-gene-11.16-mRNA-1 protein AED:1.00 eAED:1.00 QI:0/-1/0/0/-1/1/1/0/493
MANLGKAVKGEASHSTASHGEGSKSEESGGKDDEILRHKLEQKLKHLHELRSRLQGSNENLLENEEVLERLKAETDLTNFNQSLIEEKYLTLMRRSQNLELKHALKVLCEDHIRDLDRKNQILSDLKKESVLRKNLREKALLVQANNLKKLIGVKKLRCETVQVDLEELLCEIQDFSNRQKQSISTEFASLKTNLRTQVDSEKEEEKERKSNEQQEFEQNHEELKNRNLEDLNILKLSMEGLIQELEQKVSAEHLRYTQNTEQKSEDFKFLLQKDEDLGKEIESKITKIDSLQTQLQGWRQEISSASRENLDRNTFLVGEKKQLQEHFAKLKKRLKTFRRVQKSNLLILTKDFKKRKQVLKKKEAVITEIFKLVKVAWNNPINFYVTKGQRFETFEKMLANANLELLRAKKKLNETKQKNKYLVSIQQDLKYGTGVHPDIFTKENDRQNPLLMINGGETFVPELQKFKVPVKKNLTKIDGNEVIKTFSVQGKR